MMSRKIIAFYSENYSNSVDKFKDSKVKAKVIYFLGIFRYKVTTF